VNLTPSDADIDGILRIGHESSIRNSAGVSMEEALRRTCYRKLRSGIDHAKIVAALQARPQAVHDWIMYSQDKRTNGGWYIDPESCRIGRHGHENSTYSFGTLTDAVAAYILHELDYWSGRATELP
jgi:hypothetical protein